MRVLQLIDSLRPGGAENMAVNIANSLSERIEASYICCTRKEGILLEKINPKVHYYFLKKKNTLDLNAIYRLRSFLNSHKIDIVHAHGTSYFMASLLKFAGLNFELVWHDHFGNSDYLQTRNLFPLKIFSKTFSEIIAVNSNLAIWSRHKLNHQNVSVIKNFIPEPILNSGEKVVLQGNIDAFKIFCVANLRPQKDHANLIQSFLQLNKKYNISLHLIGENPGTEYAHNLIQSLNPEDNIYYYGAVNNVSAYLMQADMGILSSKSEGLPLVILEYALAQLPVVSTNVGEIENVIGEFGKLVPPEDSHKLTLAIKDYLDHPERAQIDAQLLNKKVKEEYSEDIVIQQFISVYNNLCFKQCDE